ncbi:MAG: hypothetical protein WCD79_07490 [Chthoniobacteraceae bacterium]
MEPKGKPIGPDALQSLIAAWTGRAGKPCYLTLFLPALFTLWAACLFLSAHCYPGYRFYNHDISDLGDPGMNPHGWRYWSLGMGIAAILSFPPVAYASRRMKELIAGQSRTGIMLAALGSICMRCTCLGLMGLALVPQGSDLRDIIHITSGVFAFGGEYVTFLFLWGVALFKVREISAPRLAFFTASAWWAVVGFLTTQTYRFFAYGEVGHEIKHKGESLLLHFSFWEWMLFAAVTTSFAIFVALLPAKIKAAK